MTRNIDNSDEVSFEITEESKLYVDRVEDGYAHLEHVVDEEIVDRDVVAEKWMPDDIHEGVRVELVERDDGLEFKMLYRESAEKQREIRDKVDEIGISMDEYNKGDKE